ncbi:MAG: hypothetical protein IJW13_02785 [Clostridia bacterium]|nr:hypothetical protein [Clostridia bacterium]
MQPTVITILFLCILTAILFTVFSFKKNLIYLYTKTFSSVLFTALGLVCLYYFIKNGWNKISDNQLIGSFLLLFGLVLCLVGDIILGMPRLSELRRDTLPVIVGGAAWFTLGHITYCIALIFLLGISPWVLCFIIPMALFYTYGNKLFGKLDYKKLTAGVLIYSLLESLSFALCATALIFNFSISALLLTIGFTLFYFSDMVLMHNYFGEKKRYISVLCHATYYPAQIIIALSILFIV